MAPSPATLHEVFIVPGKELSFRGEPCPALRHLVCAAPQEAYEQARKQAEKVRKTADLRGRAVLSFMFDDVGFSEIVRDIEAVRLL